MLRSFPLLLLLPAVALAQTPEVVKKVDAKLDAERVAQRNEDVEILRRLLNKATGLPDKGQAMKTGFVSGTGSERLKLVTTNYPTTVGPFDGVYLPGAGVVFTLHVPAGVNTPHDPAHGRVGLGASCLACHDRVEPHDKHPVTASANQCSTCHDTSVSLPTPLSDWDRVKQDVRGGPPKPADKPKDDKPRAAVCEPGDLHTLIAGVLAANARHVRHLPEKEGITVVVTFDEVKPAGGAVAPAGPSEPVFTADEVKQAALGDLHLKAGKHAEAVKAYSVVLGRFTSKEWKVTAPPGLTAEQRNQFADELQNKGREMFKSYAKALLLADQPDKAKWALEMATGFVVLEVTPTTVPASSTAPAKLIVGVTKAEVDSAKDAAEAKKAVKAERLNFPK